MERRAEYCRACCAMQAEAEGNENGNLHAGIEGQRGASTVDARSTTSPAEAGLKSYVGYAFARVHGTESGRINFVVDDAFAVTEYYILQ